MDGIEKTGSHYILLLGNIKNTASLQGVFPAGAQSVCFEPFTLLGKQAMVYAQRNGICAEILCAAPAADEYAQITMYQRALLSGTYTYMLILYSEFTYPLAFVYGLAKALGIPCRKKKVG